MKNGFKLAIAAAMATIALGSISIAQEDDLKVIWGGGDVKSSTYSNTYVPHIIDILAQNRLAGYQWGGISAGTLENAQKVTEHPTNLAVGQWDLLADLNGKPIPGAPGKNYSFTVLAKDIGPECLYLVTDQEGYETFGHVLGNAWDMTIATGGEASGSYGTLKRLQSLYPDLDSALIVSGGGALDIVERVATDDGVTHGFFVQRPDPASDTFKRIKDLGLTLIPVVDFDLEGHYTFMDLKVANGGLFGGAEFHTTACTSVALITGDPSSTDGSNPRVQKRLQETIKRIGAINQETLKPNISSWADMWDSIKQVTADRATELMESSKAALEESLNKI